jgi:hypothetical protein
MSTRVTVTSGDGGVVAVKTATTPDQVADLALEASRLQQASHPGVVGFIEHRVRGDRAELRTHFAGEPLGRWRGTPAQAAGIVAAVAATMADLHELGVVHGRIDPSHVLLDADGRPRLCGWSSSSTVQDASPPDDVAALGRLLETLVDRTVPSDGVRPSWFLWPRARAADRRALAQVVAHATDAVVTRRPAACTLARSILTAVPGAELAPVGRATRPVTAAAPDEPSEPALDLPGESLDDFGTFTLEPLPAAAAELDRRETLDDPALSLDADPVVSAPGSIAGGADGHGDDLFADRDWDNDVIGRLDADIPAVRGGSPGTGKRPASHRRPNVRRHLSRGVAGVAIVLALAVVAAGASVWRPSSPSDVGAQEPAVPPAPTAARPCAPTEPLDAETDANADLDVDGDGCPDAVRVAGSVVEAAGQRWAVGAPGDRVAVGDWDCDGTATPAVYRPSSGDVFVFVDWAAADQPLTTVAVAQVAGGRALAAPQPGGASCGVVSVQLEAGGQRTVDVTP